MIGVRAAVTAILLAAVPMTANWMQSEADGDAVVVSGRDRDAQSGGGERSETSSSSGHSQPDFQCPTLTWVYGIYSVEAQNCNNELPTDWAPLLEPEEEVDGVEQSDQLLPLTVSREDVQSLLVDAGGLEIQPDRSWVLVHVETIAFTGATEQILTTTVLDAPIEVRVTPESFTWDFGDGSAPLVTTDPGAPWPAHTVAHSYSAAQDSVVVTVRTEWDAVFRIPGVSPWLPVAGTVVTTESSETFEVVTATPRLVTGSR